MRAADKRDFLGYLGQKSGYIFLFCVFLAFMQAGILAGQHQHQLQSYPDVSAETRLPDPTSSLSFSPVDTPPKSSIKEHPIPSLMEEAEIKYRKKLGGQSKTLRAAVAEYKGRYKRDPPRGFDEWWKFAREHGVKMVDEYDGLMNDLAPFWELSGQELRRRVTQVMSPLRFVMAVAHKRKRWRNYPSLTWFV